MRSRAPQIPGSFFGTQQMTAANQQMAAGRKSTTIQMTRREGPMLRACTRMHELWNSAAALGLSCLSALFIFF